MAGWYLDEAAALDALGEGVGVAGGDEDVFGRGDDESGRIDMWEVRTDVDAQCEIDVLSCAGRQPGGRLLRDAVDVRTVQLGQGGRAARLQQQVAPEESRIGAQQVAPGVEGQA